MERYFPVVKNSYARNVHNGIKKPSLDQSQDASSRKSTPTEEQSFLGPSASETRPDLRHVSRSDLNRVLLTSLGKEANPITHSDIAERSDFVQSMKGHQRSEDRTNRRLYTNEREAKLKVQPKSVPALKSETQIFRNVRIYINGYLEGTTDIEVKQIVTEGGGTVVPTPSRSTHIITSTGLNGSKAQKYVESRTQRRYIVNPGWIFDSVAKGKRRSEAMYSVRIDKTSGGSIFG